MRKRKIEKTLYLSEEENKILEEKCKKLNLSKSDYIRKLIKEYTNSLDRFEFELLLEIVQRNENGEIYGSELFLDEIGVQPDLILAEGTNGKVGYVRADDINDAEITTPEQAAEKMLSSKSREIPLYDSDGTTIIGSFSLHPSGDIELGQLEP